MPNRATGARLPHRSGAPDLSLMPFLWIFLPSVALTSTGAPTEIFPRFVFQNKILNLTFVCSSILNHTVPFFRASGHGTDGVCTNILRRAFFLCPW
ncbi:hypothetical protein PVL29_025606 [Vitis rotundifolia]|uniref:Secreted protein n=1 Tax=Vitis rotundifolia TaxID=103349 RepID=A0AA38YKA3_VITRO|nr:hypothetical protein PVL29_025606 [Vitis rotundifolia]